MRLDFILKTKKWCIIILIGLIIFGFFIYVITQQGIEYKDKLMVCISFAGLFATFGGAYLGAKISGDNARKLYEKQKRNKMIAYIKKST